MILSPTIISLLATPLTVSNLLIVCQGFTAPITQHRIIPRTISSLHYKDEDTSMTSTGQDDAVNALLQDKKLLSSRNVDAEQFAADACGIYGLCDIKDIEAALSQPPKKSESLRAITFEDDIEKYFDITKYYYALDNEYAIVDDATGEMVGFVCTTGRVDMPAGRESGGIPFAEASRHLSAAGSVATLLRNPEKKRFHYPASKYHIDVYPNKGKVQEELAKINGGELFSATANDPIIFVRCDNLSKQSSSCDILLETDDTTYAAECNFNIMPATNKKKSVKYPLPSDDVQSAKSPYEGTVASLHNIKSFSGYHSTIGHWLTMEGSLPSDCLVDFYNKPSLSHSALLFHNGDLIGKAISEFTDIDLPFKKSDFGQEPGMKMISWMCSLENALSSDVDSDLKFQSKVVLGSGEIGKTGSTYTVQCQVKQGESVIYKATGTFILEPVKFLKAEFRHAIGNKDFDMLWNKLDVNGNGVVSREELQQFVTSSGIGDLSDKEFRMLFPDSMDEDFNDDISPDELAHYFNSLHLRLKEDFGKCIAEFLENGCSKEVSTLWSKLDIDGDGVVSVEELSLFIASELSGFSTDEVEVLHKEIDTNGDGVVDFSEFQSYLYSLKFHHDFIEHGFVCVPKV